MKRQLRFSTLVVGYAILISAWFISWLLLGDHNWWLISINRVVPYLFLPIPFFFGWIIFSRNFRAVVPLLLPTLIFGGLYHPYLIPKFARPLQSSTPFVVMTYNVLYNNLNYDAVARVILTYHPDLVALQEVQPAMMDGLEERLAEDYPYFIMGTENSFGTTAVFSRHPFIDAFVLDLQADRPVVVVETKVRDEEITFVALHLLAYGLQWVKLHDIPAALMERTARQNRQVEILLEEIKQQDGIVIVGCDCNSKETSSSYRILARAMENSAREVGWLLSAAEVTETRPDTALQHIDYIWYRGNLEPVGVYAATNARGSDHLPLLAFFDLK